MVDCEAYSDPQTTSNRAELKVSIRQQLQS
jgi:hypothetical protein